VGKASRDWERYARALDLRLEGKTLGEVGASLGVSRERSRQMIIVAGRRLAYRVFGGKRIHWRFNEKKGLYEAKLS